MTYKKFLQSISEGVNSEEIRVEAQRLLRSLELKGAKRRAKSMGNNEEIKAIILEVLGDEILTNREIRSKKADWDITSQKLSGVLSQMFRNGEIKRHDNGSNKAYSYEVV